MKTLLCTALLAILSAAAASADVTITFDQPHQTGGPGAILQFFGTITNNSTSTVYLNFDALDLAGLGLATDDPFLFPVSLAPGATSADIDLVDVTVSDPLLDDNATYPGTYTLFGGVDGNAQDNLGQAAFSITTVPEPASFGLLLSTALGVLYGRRFRTPRRP